MHGYESERYLIVVEIFSLNGRRDLASRLYSALNLPFKQFTRARPGSDMVVEKEATMPCGAGIKGGWLTPWTTRSADICMLRRFLKKVDM